MNLPKLSTQWPWLFTVLIILVAIVAFVVIPGTDTLSQVGDFVAGFAAALAFIWLIAAYRLQAQELSLQRNELTLQREAVQQHRDESRKMAKYAALEQASRILDQFEQSLRRNPDDRPQSISALRQTVGERVLVNDKPSSHT
jgi:hypothetical protein